MFVYHNIQSLYIHEDHIKRLLFVVCSNVINKRVCVEVSELFSFFAVVSNWASRIVSWYVY